MSKLDLFNLYHTNEVFYDRYLRARKMCVKSFQYQGIDILVVDVWNAVNKY